MPANVPYIISGVCTYQYFNSSAANRSGVKVTAYSSTNKEWLKGSAQSTTNSAGEYTIDLANMPTSVANNDIIYLFAIGTNESMNARIIVNTTQGSATQNFIMHEGSAYTSRCLLTSVSTANLTGSAARVDYIDIRNDLALVTQQVGANTTVSSDLKNGVLFLDGIARIFSDTGNRNLVSTMVIDQGVY